MEKGNMNDELLDIIRKELNAIIAEEKKVPSRKISYDELMKPKALTTSEPKKLESKCSIGKTKKNVAIVKPSPSYRQAASGKAIIMKPSSKRLTGGQENQKASSASTATSTQTERTNQIDWDLAADRALRVEFMESQAVKSIDEDLQKMQLELKQSYELFQDIADKFESINFGSLKSRIHDLHLNTMNNDLGKATTLELQKMFENRYMQNRLDMLTADVSTGFRRLPGEFGDIPELSTFFQACTQLEHGLDNLKRQRKRSNDLENRLCWATEIAYDRMDEIRNSVGSSPESNF